jgi:hypothetical protein
MSKPLVSTVTMQREAQRSASRRMQRAMTTVCGSPNGGPEQSRRSGTIRPPCVGRLSLNMTPYRVPRNATPVRRLRAASHAARGVIVRLIPRAPRPYPASSRDRAVAAAIARLIAAGQASGAISTFSAASVVPAGLVTARRSAAASSLLAASSAPDPATV